MNNVIDITDMTDAEFNALLGASNVTDINDLDDDAEALLFGDASEDDIYAAVDVLRNYNVDIRCDGVWESMAEYEAKVSDAAARGFQRMSDEGRLVYIGECCGSLMVHRGASIAMVARRYN